MKKIILFCKKGNAAIILSLIVSSAILSTIYISQNTVNWFMSSQETNMEGWEYAFVSKLATSMAGYMISNNLVLCKEKGWKAEDTLCRWNDQSKWHPDDSSVISLKDDFNMKVGPVKENDDGRKIFRLTGTLDSTILEVMGVSNNDIQYQVTFDLVNWKETSIQSMIGNIPASACRNTETMAINTDGICPESTACTDSNGQYIPNTVCEANPSGTNNCLNTSTQNIDPKYSCPQSNACKDSNDQDISNTLCEYIADTDQDHSIVLISVTTPLEEGNPLKKTVFAGIKRPLSIMPILKVLQEPVCRLSCPSNNTTTALPECRGEFTPSTANPTATMKVRLTNPGPGVIYAISVLRKDTLLNPDPLQDRLVEFDVTGDLVEQYGIKLFFPTEAILPGESIEFNDKIECEDTVEFSFEQINQNVGRGSLKAGTAEVYEKVNVHADPFKQVVYSLFSLQNPIGVCMSDDSDWNTKKPLQEPDPACPNKYAQNQSCHTVGQCHYPYIEPQRYSMPNSSGSSTINSKKTTHLMSITVYRVPPH